MHDDSLNRIGIKVLAAASAASAQVRMRDFVPVFHTWIQEQCLDGHLLIDVHDYSHIHNGPGILLVAHEGNFSIDMSNGEMGLAYYRKQPTAGSMTERLNGVLKSALQASSLLEDESRFENKLRFRTDQWVFFANDRLAAPNDSKTLASIESDLRAVFEPLLGKATLSTATDDPKERFSVRIRGERNADLKHLLPLLRK